MEWWNYVIAGAGVILGAVIKWLLDKYGNKYAKAALDFLNDIIVISVYAVNQIYVDEIKKGREDGTLTDEEKKKAKDMAWDYIFKQIPPKFLDALKKLFGSTEALSAHIETNIEATVQEAKQPF